MWKQSTCIEAASARNNTMAGTESLAKLGLTPLV